MDTGGRKWGRPYLNRSFFSLIGERMADDILLVMAKRGGRYVAGAINFIGSDALYGRHWGCVEDHPFLHFEVCYHQAIDLAIAHKLARVEAGAQGEHKSRARLPAGHHATPPTLSPIPAFVARWRTILETRTPRASPRPRANGWPKHRAIPQKVEIARRTRTDPGANHSGHRPQT